MPSMLNALPNAFGEPCCTPRFVREAVPVSRNPALIV